MVSGKQKYRILLVSSSDKIEEPLSELLASIGYEVLLRAKDAGEARRMLLSTTADVIIINTPLTDEFGTELALDFSEDPVGVLLLVKNELFEHICYKVEDYGVLTLAKPMSRQGFSGAVRLLMAMVAKLNKLEKKNRSLQEKISDIRVVSQAKGLLIQHNGLSENDAHYFVEKKAMNERISRREAAQRIIDSYEK